ncbi:glycoside hydrolase family protein [Flavivirga algicola]|uniref:Uncharacterized protein n=1 Tax=Flavivirga algicola TaxID=2729136 RepID=A0ABX1RUT5_9FLAO|nr:glycoside hydrolase family protein [Flavivirga algicola]NMH86813.1 hypothetical protein [Flavivirga algicola]
MSRIICICTLAILFFQCQKQQPLKEKIVEQKTLIDFFQPFEQQAPLVKENIWGDMAVIPRDTANGLEDATLKNWCYWDGKIVKDDEGKYHMYASRWSQAFHHGVGWTKDSKGIHAVSDNLYGPYKDLGLAWPQWKEGKGHNVIGLRMHDDRYALVTSEIVPGQVFVSDTPYGPFELLGDFKIDPNGYYPGWGRYNELDDGALRGGGVGNLANVMIILRPDDRYMMIARHCVAMISDDGILGPYKMLSDKAWLNVKGLPQFKMEDPTVWYSDSLYHIVVNHYGGGDTTYHLTSEDGIHNWKNRGKAFERGAGVFRHKDGIIEDWFTVQRPTVYTEDNMVKAFNFSVIDVHKGQDAANDENASKIIVVPFDGEGFRKHIRSIVNEENKISDNTLPPKPWQSADIGNPTLKGNTGYDEIVNTIRIKSAGNNLEGTKDAFRFVHQKMTGDVSAKVMVLSHDISSQAVKSGLMFRSSLNEDASYIMASIDKDEGFKLEYRAQDGVSSEIVKTLDIEAPYWLRLEKRDHIITTYISSSNRLNWTKIGDMTSDFGESFYVGMVSTSKQESVSSLSRFKDIDVHNYGEPLHDGIVSHTFPDTIPSSGIIDFEVELESVKTLDVWVELENVQTHQKYKVLRQRFWKNGIRKLTYNAGSKLDPNATYWFVIKAVPMHFHDSEHVQASFKKVFVEK